MELADAHLPTLRALAQEVAFGLLLLDGQGRVVWLNDAMRALLGLPEGDGSPALGLAAADLPSVRAAGLTPLIERLLRGQGFQDVVVEVTSRDARPVTAHLSGGAHHDGSGAPAGAWVLASDLAPQASDGGRLLALQRMEVVGLAVTGVIHDLNNMLLALSGTLELFRAGEGATAPLVAALDAMVRRSKDIAARLLEVARPGTDAMTPLDLRTPVRQAADLLRHGLAPGLHVRLALPPRQVPAIGHRTALLQALFNLGTNARDALAGKGQIDLSLAIVRDEAACAARGWPGLRYAVLRVQDDGPGVPRDVADRIFQPFFTTKGQRGTGMGLAVVLRVVTDHGGEVELIPSGGGACFEIRLPMHVGAVDDDEPTRTMTIPSALRDPVQPLRGLRVLVADDEEAVRLMLMQALTLRGAELTLAPDGDAALEAAEAALAEGLPFERALVDLHMPGLDGLDLIDALKLRSEGTRVVATSGLEPDPSVGTALAAGGVRFLQKPFRLAEAVEALLAP